MACFAARSLLRLIPRLEVKVIGRVVLVLPDVKLQSAVTFVCFNVKDLTL
jgi:hypothetical protein